ncbi:hypothetical protein NDI43_22330 [Microcoleus vaginatus GB2-A3]|uniref:hypothetical protein n=1 Tax=Microcoleus vaginatus TaxID=119532 RepID=UPI0032A77107
MKFSFFWISCGVGILPAQASVTGKMPVPQGFHRQDACATRISQASCLRHKNSCGVGILPAPNICTGKMPVPQKFLWGGHLARPKYLHRQDACATKILVGWASSPPQIFAQARCLCHKNSCGVGILPAQTI